MTLSYFKNEGFKLNPWGEGQFCVPVARLWCPVVWSITSLDVAMKVFCRCD